LKSTPEQAYAVFELIRTWSWQHY